jgi:UDP-GlcNAc:undecaprenyl-phosphate/decaprenyl-phosphate GlcNAc-1-phosphate transferase
MHAAILLAFTAFLLCLIFTPLCRDEFIRRELLDHPDGGRKQQKRSIPRAGGLAIAISYAMALLLLLCFGPRAFRIYIQHKELLLSLLLPAAIIFLTGLIDDLFTLKPLTKLAGQCVGVALAVALGARLTLIGGHPAPLWLAAPLSGLWLLLCINALNLIDGLDGLAGGVALSATLTTLLTAILHGDTGLVMATAPLACCLLAFLRYNFDPASVYLGDCGSLTIGFLLGSFALIWSSKSATLMGMAAPMMMLALPLLEVFLSIGRRYLRSQPILAADRGHIHHRLLALGLTPRDVALTLYGVCGLSAVLSLLQSLLSRRFQGSIVVLFAVLIIVGVRKLRYAEFSAARKLFSQRRFLRSLKDWLYLEEITSQLYAARTPEELWMVLEAVTAKLDFASVEFELDGEVFGAIFEIADTPPSWEMTANLESRGKLRLTRLTRQAMSEVTMSALHKFQEAAIHAPLPPLSPEKPRGYYNARTSAA